MPYRKDRIMKLIGFSPDEWAVIEKRAAMLGKRTGTYIREISVRGEIKKFDMKLLNDVRIALIKIGTNINQISTVVNSSKTIYEADIRNLKKEFYELSDIMKNWLKPFE